MNIIEQAVLESRIESAENRIRHTHNQMESERCLGRKRYLSYKSGKFLDMVLLVQGLCPRALSSK